MTEIKCRAITRCDSADILDWRNDLHTRNMSLTTDTISYDEHSEWFAKMLNDCSHIGFIGEINGEKIGAVFVKVDNKKAKISINLNPAFRGKKFSTALLKICINSTLILYPKIVYFIAEIKSTNTASFKIFSKNGFKVSSDQGKYSTYTMQTKKSGRES
ncbi:GNAT family N-acetyltransferase [Paracoccaceae bacterium]|nr:GNAT family N-acetyltransferase [Paracoccaceae bacterium]